jgi:flagella basal body P-ring formation protein FlgA
LLACAAGQVQAAELRLRAECRCTQSLVRLGDVAEIHAADAEHARELEAIELFPTPSPGQQRYVRAREIQDLLALRGLNLSQHRLSGASRVQVSAAEIIAAAPPAAPQPLSSSAVTRANEQVEAAIIAYLRQAVSENEPWQVEVKLDNDQARIISGARQAIGVAGGEAPWKGCKRLNVIVPAAEGEQQFEIEAVISTPPMVVVALRGLVPGDTVQATDVKFAQRTAVQADNPFYRLEDVVGLQTVRAIVEGQVLDRADVRSPLLVRRGDAVTVFSRSAGIQVRTTARAQEEGGRGDLITVESMLNRQRFFARVTGIHEVEVFAHAVETRSAVRDPIVGGRNSPASRPEFRPLAEVPPVGSGVRPAGAGVMQDRNVRGASYQYGSLDGNTRRKR